MTRIVAWCLGFMKWVSDDPSYVTGGEPKYPQELFSAVDLLSLQFLVSMVFFGRISPNRFLSSILLVMVIIVAVVIVMVIWVVIFVDMIVGVVIVVAIIGVVVFVTIIGIVVVIGIVVGGGGVPSIIKLSFVIIGWAYAFHQDKASSVKVPVANVTLFSSAHLLRENTDSVRSNQRMRISLGLVFLLGLLALAMAAVYASRAAVKSAISCRMASKVMAGVSDVDVLLGGILSTQDNA
ncbi:hypothetical protein Tco_1434432 [Tanacetum coccineum]